MSDTVKRSIYVQLKSQREERVGQRQYLKRYFSELIKDVNLQIEETQ